MTNIAPLAQGPGPKTVTKEHIPGRTVPAFTSKNLTIEQRHKIVLKELGWDLLCYSTPFTTKDGSSWYGNVWSSCFS